MVAVCAADNALIESPTLTAEHLSSLHWIVSYDATTQYTPADKHLRFAGVERQVEVVVQNFLGLPFLLACTNRVATRSFSANRCCRIATRFVHASRKGKPRKFCTTTST